MMSEKRSSVDEDILARFVCTGCGVCCRWPGHVLLTDADIKELAGHLAMDEAILLRNILVWHRIERNFR